MELLLGGCVLPRNRRARSGSQTVALCPRFFFSVSTSTRYYHIPGKYLENSTHVLLSNVQGLSNRTCPSLECRIRYRQ